MRVLPYVGQLDDFNDWEEEIDIRLRTLFGKS